MPFVPAVFFFPFNTWRALCLGGGERDKCFWGQWVRKEGKGTEPTGGETRVLLPAETQGGTSESSRVGSGGEEQVVEWCSRRLVLRLESCPGTDKLPESLQVPQRSWLVCPRSKSEWWNSDSTPSASDSKAKTLDHSTGLLSIIDSFQSWFTVVLPCAFLGPKARWCTHSEMLPRNGSGRVDGHVQYSQLPWSSPGLALIPHSNLWHSLAS